MELALINMKAKKSHDLPSTNWTPRKAGGMIHSESEGLRTSGMDGINPNSRVREDMRCTAQW